jgi:hypothetical protein
MSFGALPHECDPRIFRVQAFRTKGVVDQASKVHLRMYFLQAPQFANPTPTEGETRLSELADVNFLRDVDKETQDLYQVRILLLSTHTRTHSYLLTYTTTNTSASWSRQ